jgi:hypothetical protein
MHHTAASLKRLGRPTSSKGLASRTPDEIGPTAHARDQRFVIRDLPKWRSHQKPTA